MLPQCDYIASEMMFGADWNMRRTKTMNIVVYRTHIIRLSCPLTACCGSIGGIFHLLYLGAFSNVTACLRKACPIRFEEPYGSFQKERLCRFTLISSEIKTGECDREMVVRR